MTKVFRFLAVVMVFNVLIYAPYQNFIAAMGAIFFTFGATVGGGISPSRPTRTP